MTLRLDYKLRIPDNRESTTAGKRRKQLARLNLLWLTLLASWLGGCAVSTAPLSDPGQGKPDDRLIGSWGDGDKTVFFQLAHAGGRLPANVMVLTSERQEEQAKGANRGPVLVFPSVIGDNRYLNIALLEADETLQSLKEIGWKPDRHRVFVIVRYTLSDDVLKITPMNAAAVEKAIEANRIKGDISKKTNTDAGAIADAIADSMKEPIRTVIDDSSENVRRMVESDRDLFIGKDIPFKRPKQASGENAKRSNND